MAGNHEAVRSEIVATHDATGLTEAYRDFADQRLAEYDLDGWTVPDLVNPDDVNMIGKFNLRARAVGQSTGYGENHHDP